MVSLSGSNYHSWTLSMRMRLPARSKLSLIDFRTLVPTPKDPLSNARDKANVLVLGWIQGFISSEIAQTVLWFNIVVEAWKDLLERFMKAMMTLNL
ncbi:unnamed protein product [Linum trigynum]|uniref:Retrotransposon Copia-like N-terminal domain-containing protein n=1 Tax=Linum trigynum TaxID=586398 RepID=A0AAV2GT74_9ROSI